MLARVGRYVWVIPRPANRAGVEVWVGPFGVSLTWPLRRPGWSWGWWRIMDRVGDRDDAQWREESLRKVRANTTSWREVRAKTINTPEKEAAVARERRLLDAARAVEEVRESPAAAREHGPAPRPPGGAV